MWDQEEFFVHLPLSIRIKNGRFFRRKRCWKEAREAKLPMNYLIRDRDRKYCREFNESFEGGGSNQNSFLAYHCAPTPLHRQRGRHAQAGLRD